jgi:hypothetical protein
MRILALLLFAASAYGVQPMPGGVRIQWDKNTNDVGYYVWKLLPASTNWTFLDSITNNVYLYTNTIIDGTMFGVSATQLTNGFCCISSDIGVAGWPPAISTPQKTVKLSPTNGYVLATNKWVKISSDLRQFDDWFRVRPVGSNLLVDFVSNPLKPYMFMAYPTNPIPPFPPQ